MIKQNGNVYELHTDNTSYIFMVTESGHLEHIYYGARVHADVDAIREKHTFIPGNTNVYSAEYSSVALEDTALEMSSYGKGDIREPFIVVKHEDGSTTSDFIFKDAIIHNGKTPMDTLPSSYDDAQADELVIRLKDRSYGEELELYYYVFEKCDVIARRAVLYNEGTDYLCVKRLMSMQLDMDNDDYIMSTFNGAWINEMNRHDCKVTGGKHVNSSYAGTSSSRANPFIMLGKEHTTQDTGECFGFNLIYSGNHYEAACADEYGRLRVVTGINPENFEYTLEAGEKLEVPEAVFTYSVNGYNGMSQNMHAFVRNYIVRGSWKDRERPMLLNSWETAYFNINQAKLLRLAKEAAKAGIELFVVDDGWFKGRKNDACGLGDWTADTKKFPDGISGMADKITQLGMKFGIWVEPEMVNTDSDLYRAHPDWAIGIPDRPHSEGRNQRILDLSNPEVTDYIIEAMTNVFSSADISYVKWDMNRIFSDYYSGYLTADRQGELAHRYVCGLYRCMDELTKRFPDILFEGCSAGGNRFDLGILCYFPQIWGSDNTDASARARIQNNYSYAYPMETVSAHISDCPNHQTLRGVSLDTRYAVAAFGSLGYECNLCDMNRGDYEAVARQIELYKAWRSVFQKGTFYRCMDGNVVSWCVVSEDKTRAVGLCYQNMNMPDSRRMKFIAKGLEPDKKYHFYNISGTVNIKDFGGLINTMSPVHIKPESAVMNIASRVITKHEETEDYVVYGDTLMNCGVRLHEGYAATGYSEDIRVMKDFSSRLYYMEMLSDDKE